MRDRSRKSGLRLSRLGSGHAAILTPNGSPLGTRPSAAQRSTNRHVIRTVSSQRRPSDNAAGDS